MAYNTGNPVGSTDPRDFKHNAETFDQVMNGAGKTATNRVGNQVYTMAGLAGLASGIPAVLASEEAQAARDAALLNAELFSTVQAGIDAVADDEYFKVVGSGNVAAAIYKRISASSAQKIIDFPSANLVKNVQKQMADWGGHNFTLNWESGFFYNYSTGVKTAFASFKCVKFAITGDELGIRVSAKTQGAATALAVYYDAAGVYIGYQEQASSTTVAEFVDFELTVPTNARFIAFSCPVTLPNAELEVLNYFVVSDKIKSIEDGMSLWGDHNFTINWETGFYYNYSTGVKTAFSSFKCVKFAITGDELGIRVSAKTQGAATALAVYYDAAGVYIGYQEQASSTAVAEFVDFELTVPTNARFIAFSCPVTLPNAELEVLSHSSLVNLQEELRNNIKPGVDYFDFVSTPWEGKKIVWFGTSIPAGGWGMSYPSLIADYTRSNVINEAIGGSMIRNGKSSIATIDDPYGWSGHHYRQVAYSLAATIDEKNYFIENYSSIKNILTTFNRPDYLTEDEKNLIRDCSFENRLARHLGDDRADLFVIDHGHNDNQFLDILDIPDQPYDRGNYFGACGFIIKKILEDNPRARIVIIGHYENDRKQDITQAQILLAEDWDIPIFELWKKLGWTQKTITYGGEEKTITQIWMPDDLHPSSDLTGAATTLIARTIIPFLRDVSPL